MTTQTSTQEPKVYIIHENSAWVEPLREALDSQATDYEEWFIDRGQVRIDVAPPPGVFYNRMSASSHTRGHRHAVDLTQPVLAWLEAHDRRVVNKGRALQLEVSKISQYIGLHQFGLRTPRTIATVGSEELISAVLTFKGRPFVIKPNRGGKGTGVFLFESVAELKKYMSEHDIGELSLDGIVLVQDYIKPRDGQIVRMEFIGGKFYYAVSVDSRDGFDLCPADECIVEDPGKASVSKFSILEGFSIPEIRGCEAFLEANDIEIAAIEFAEDENGDRFIYDVNTNTNYNPAAEASSTSGLKGMEGIARFLTDELEKIGSSRH